MKLALGTAQFGLSYGVANTSGQISVNEACKILDYCKAVGINTIDTAIDYGTSEECLGASGVDEFDVITKIPAIPKFCPDVNFWLKSQLESSLMRMNLKSVYGVMLHRPEQLFGSFGPAILKSLADLKDKGKVKKIGVSVYDPKELEDIYSLYEFDLVQTPFNLIDRRLVSTGWLDRLNERGVEIHCRSCFLQGLLAMPKEDIPKKFSAWEGLWSNWHGWLGHGTPISAVEACIAFIDSFEGIGKIVVGVDSQEQLEQLVAASKKKIDVKSLPDISSDDTQLINPSNWSSF